MTGTELPLVYVCVPTYNAAETLGPSLDSILAQTYANIKVMVVDNASTDDTLRIADSYAARDPRVKVLRNQENVGAEGNFTRCIGVTGGDYTAIYHSDDIYLPGMVSAAVDFLEKYRETGVVFTAAEEIDSTGATIGRRRPPPELGDCRDGKTFGFEEVFRAVLRNGNFLTFPTALVRTSIYRDEIKAWNGEKFKSSADLDVWLRVAEKHRLGFIDRPLLRYRVSTASFSYSHFRLRTHRQDLFLVLEDYVARYIDRLDRGALDDYRLLHLKDDISIAINHVIQGERRAALSRLKGIFGPLNFIQSFRSRSQLRILAIGWAAFLAALLPLGEAGRKALARVRHKG